MNAWNKAISNLRLLFFFILFAVVISMSIVLNGYTDMYSQNDESASYDKILITGTEQDAEPIKSFIDHVLRENTSDNTSDKTKVFTSFSFVTSLNGIDILFLLYIVVFFICLHLFIFLPNNWTLVNHKVRLDD
jgi:cbb3-type cytochrome oxidase subunit 3